MLSDSEPEPEQLCRLLGRFASFSAAPTNLTVVSRSDSFTKHEMLEFVGAPVHVHIFELHAELSDSLNRDLMAHVPVAMETPSLEVSNSGEGSFHSALTLFERPIPTATTLKSIVADAVARVESCEGMDQREAEPRPKKSRVVTDANSISCCPARVAMPHAWMNVLPPGGHHILHNHAGATWSGAYYVNIPDYDSSGPAGQLLLRVNTGGVALVWGYKPTEGSCPPKGWCEYALLKPKKGCLVVFPADLQHCVLPVAACTHCPRTANDTQRVSVSFNF